MNLTFDSDFAWRFMPIKGQLNRYYFVIHGGDERKFCGESERVILIDDDEGIPQTVFISRERNRKALKYHFSPINAYQFLHSVLPDHAIRRYFPQVIPAMEARLSDNAFYKDNKRRLYMLRKQNMH